MAGTGNYDDTRPFTPSDEDVEETKREMRQMASPQCPECLEDLQQHLESGAMRSKVDIDPYMKVNCWVTEEDASFSDDYEVRKTGHAMAYCEEHSEEAFMLYKEFWFQEEEDDREQD